MELNENSRQEFMDVLRAPSHEDTKVDALASVAATRIWQAISSYTEGLFSEDEVEFIRDTLHTTLHWAVHIGQSAWRLLENAQPGCLFHEHPVDWRIAVKDLYNRPFVMLDTDDSFLNMLIDIEVEVRMEGGNSSISGSEQPNAASAFTSARIRNDTGQPGPQEPGAARMGGVEDHLYRSARLYIRDLEWLMYSQDCDGAAVSDCFVSLCAIALSMSGDALRIRWPI